MRKKIPSYSNSAVYPLCQIYQSYESTNIGHILFKKVVHNIGKSDECDFSTKCIGTIQVVRHQIGGWAGSVL